MRTDVTTDTVNQHYLGHVVELSASSDIEASEDIVAANGLKLLAKGARIDGRVRDRLLQHRLTKPLEQMMRVVDGVATRRIDRVAEELVERHALLRQLCGEVQGPLLTTALRELGLTAQVDSLLSVYAGQGAARLEHAVGMALLVGALSQALKASAGDLPLLLRAGLLHDVGELYIDPALLRPGVQLDPQGWKHIATHPIVGSAVLKDMPGAGAAVAAAVLNHHERLDGFGYPQGLRGDRLSLPGQLLAVGELLMGVIESGHEAGERAAIAMKLVPGEFNRELLDRVASVARELREVMPAPRAREAGEVGRRWRRVAASLERTRAMREAFVARPPPPGTLRDTLEEALHRCDRMRAAFTSAGLGCQQAPELAAELEALAPAELAEVAIVLREIEWRIVELERLLTMRAERLAAAEAAALRGLVGAIRFADV
jgi:hypothetical protein